MCRECWELRCRECDRHISPLHGYADDEKENLMAHIMCRCNCKDKTQFIPVGHTLHRCICKHEGINKCLDCRDDEYLCYCSEPCEVDCKCSYLPQSWVIPICPYLYKRYEIKEVHQQREVRAVVKALIEVFIDRMGFPRYIVRLMCEGGRQLVYFDDEMGSRD